MSAVKRDKYDKHSSADSIIFHVHHSGLSHETII